jgi:outer membrane protein OmpA-like peptidoglycan-associated protein/tetratricopeptide (TPR) repeat protein
MKRIFYNLMLVIALAFCAMPMAAQKAKLKVAAGFYEAFDFRSASDVYNDILSSPKYANDTTTLRLAADCEVKLGRYENAESHLKQLAGLPNVSLTDLHALADIYKLQGKYREAVDVYDRIVMINANDPIASRYIAMPDFANRLKKDSTMFTITNSEVNSPTSDFAVGFYTSGKVIFSSSRGLGVGAGRSYIWNDQPYLNNYEATIGQDSSLNAPSVMGTDINTRFHEGTVSYSPSDNMLYFTRNNVLKGNVKKSKEGKLLLGIYMAKAEGGELNNLIPFTYNNKEYTLQHPTLSSNGKRIYFASNMPGTLGGMDIFYCERNGDAWREPVNMGALINTKGDEVFPFISNDTTLYFASNGQLGLGGLDQYYIKLQDGALPENLGYPVNSRYDDFGTVLFKDEIAGYFCSNRPGGKGDDDIYEFRISPPDSINIKGTVVDVVSLKPLGNALVTITNDDESVVQTFTDKDGNYTITAPYKPVVKIDGEKKDYEPGSTELTTNPRLTDYVAPPIMLKKVDFLAIGKVLYDADGTPAAGATMRLRDEKGNQLDSLIVGADGTYKFSLEENKKYILEAYKDEYVLLTKDASTINAASKVITTDFRLFKLEKGTVVRLDNIYYDYGKSDIRSDAAIELNKLVRILQDNPTMKIELSSHSDSRGGDAYNLKLSDARAKSAVKYIISQGIDVSRLVGKGYGETQLLNRCVNDVKCSDEEHQFNRRTEFKILEI